jgi:transcriptional regulator GlxA family with amidase domain
MQIAVVAYDGFTDLDLFLPWDLFHRVKDPFYAAYEGDWRVSICADRKRITSYSGVAIDTHAPLSLVQESDAVFVVSGPGSRKLIRNDAYLAELTLRPDRQLIAAIDTGALILARLGLLKGLSATTYPSDFPELQAMGVLCEQKPLVVHGNIGTGGGCLACEDLASWIVERLIGGEAAAAIRASIARVGV